MTREEAIDTLNLIRACDAPNLWKALDMAISALSQPEQRCTGCKHFDKWENEREYGYPSPCTGCKRLAEDRYEPYREEQP